MRTYLRSTWPTLPGPKPNAKNSSNSQDGVRSKFAWQSGRKRVRRTAIERDSWTCTSTVDRNIRCKSRSVFAFPIRSVCPKRPCKNWRRTFKKFAKRKSARRCCSWSSVVSKSFYSNVTTDRRQHSRVTIKCCAIANGSRKNCRNRRRSDGTCRWKRKSKWIR